MTVPGGAKSPGTDIMPATAWRATAIIPQPTVISRDLRVGSLAMVVPLADLGMDQMVRVYSV
jgi:hypothetical protein